MGKSKLLKREEIDAKYKWKLEDMFASDEQWEEEANLVLELAKELASYCGRLSESAATLLEVMKKNDELSYHVMRVYVYANQRYHQDTAVSKYQAYAAKADKIGRAHV